MERVLFLPDVSAGLLEQQMQRLPDIKLKRTRQSEFRAITGVLKGLKLITSKDEVTALGWGTDKTGERGLVIVYEQTEVRGHVIPTLTDEVQS